MTPLQQSLSKCKIEGNILFLPPMSDGMLTNYNEVRTALLNAGAKYKRNTFVFPNEAQPYIDRLMGGEKVNIKKEFQFFATPPELADYLVSLADIKKEDVILEPSAGQGAIIYAINRKTGTSIDVDYWELMPENVSILNKAELNKLIRGNFEGYDFLSKQENPKRNPTHNKIIANPPFSKNQDIDHIRKMYEVCKSGGRIVTIASNHWKHSGNKKEMQFKKWLDEIGATHEEIEAGAFKKSGTTVGGCIIIINKD